MSRKKTDTLRLNWMIRKGAYCYKTASETWEVGTGDEGYITHASDPRMAIDKAIDITDPKIVAM